MTGSDVVIDGGEFIYLYRGSIATVNTDLDGSFVIIDAGYTLY